MFEKVKDIIQKYTDVQDITPESVLTADLGLSSFDLISIISDFEEQFDIEVDDRDIMRFVSVRDIMNYLEVRP
ncbi:MAG: acyl carrier protein [Oscillospiraceae bacterium]|nr:acyl carrier protein [Oscillospiraceae bacterium]